MSGKTHCEACPTGQLELGITLAIAILSTSQTLPQWTLNQYTELSRSDLAGECGSGNKETRPR